MPGRASIWVRLQSVRHVNAIRAVSIKAMKNTTKLLAERGPERLHRPRLIQLLKLADGPVRIASAYVTDRELLISTHTRNVRLVTSMVPMDIASGATSLESLGALIDSGVECRFT